MLTVTGKIGRSRPVDGGAFEFLKSVASARQS